MFSFDFSSPAAHCAVASESRVRKRRKDHFEMQSEKRDAESAAVVEARRLRAAERRKHAHSPNQVQSFLSPRLTGECECSCNVRSFVGAFTLSIKKVIRLWNFSQRSQKLLRVSFQHKHTFGGIKTWESSKHLQLQTSFT